MPVKIVGALDLSVPSRGLPVEIQNAVEVDAPNAGIPGRMGEPLRP